MLAFLRDTHRVVCFCDAPTRDFSPFEQPKQSKTSRSPKLLHHTGLVASRLRSVISSEHVLVREIEKETYHKIVAARSEEPSRTPVNDNQQVPIDRIPKGSSSDARVV